MQTTRRRFVAGVAAGSAAAMAPRFARAQAAWPAQAIKLVVPFTPGGSTDVLARLIAQRLEPLLKQPVVIENRPGAGGLPAASAVARAESDGYTFMMGHIGTLAFNPSLHASLPYDPRTAFAAVARVATVPNIMVVNPSVPASTPAELIDYARRNPRRINYGSGGNGSAAHITTAYFAFTARLELVHVPYRGTAPAVNDLVGNHIQMMMTGGPAVLPLAAGGQLRALAVSSSKRVAFAPDLPALTESALPGFEAEQWYGIVAPQRTPREIVSRMNELVNGQLTSPEVVEALFRDGAIAAPGTPEEFARHILSEIDTWREAIQRANIRIGG